LASFKTALHWSRSCDFSPKFLMPIVIKSSTESNHLILGLPTWAPSSLFRVDLLQGFCSAF
jgi:hypothetical protein